MYKVVGVLKSVKDAELLYLIKKKQLIWDSRRNINNEIKIKISTFELLEKLEAMPNMVSIKCWTIFVRKKELNFL